MSEPNATILIAGAVATLLGKLLGPVWGPAIAAVLGPLLLITFGAVAGSVLAMSKADTNSRSEAVKFVAIGVLVALAISWIFAWALEKYFGVPTYVAFMPVAAVIAAARQALLNLMESLVQLVGTLLSALAKLKGGGQ